MIDVGQDTTFRAAEGLELNRVPDGAMVYHVERERVHFLNPTALIVFELCELGKTAEEIAIFLAEAFNLPEAPGSAVRACISSLVDEGLLICNRLSAAP